MAKCTVSFIALGLAISACGGSVPTTALPESAVEVTRPVALANTTPVGTTTAIAPQSSATNEEAHRLVIAAIACWLGGVWSDAAGVEASARAGDAERRCHQLVQRVYGNDDQASYERLRALDPVEVLDLKTKILAVAKTDARDSARQQQLGEFLDAAAAAEREAMLGRRAGDRVKRDADGSREPTKLTADELAAVSPLSEASAFEALLGLEMGELTPEARAVAILCAMDRMETAHGLTKHLKVYALARPFTVLFNTPAPVVPTDARQPLVGGAWLAYVSAAAGAAGHPVLNAAKAPADRELLAWGGATAGLADKLRLEAQQMSNATDLKRISENIVQRVDANYRASETAVLHQGGHN